MSEEKRYFIFPQAAHCESEGFLLILLIGEGEEAYFPGASVKETEISKDGFSLKHQLKYDKKGIGDFHWDYSCAVIMFQ